LALLVASLSVAWAYDMQSGEGTVVGEVTNGTPAGVVPDELVVTLHAFSGMEETTVYTTTVVSDRAFRFENVSFDEGETLVARAFYNGVAYFSELAPVEPPRQEMSLPLTIYETTDDRSNVSVAQLHVFLERSGGRLQIGQYCVVSNTGDRTYVGSLAADSGIRTTWSVRLPGGAQNLRFDSGGLGGRFVATEDGFADTRAVPPGQSGVEASFTYDVPYSPESLRLEQAFDVPVRSVVLVLPGDDLGLEGAGLSSEGALETEMGPAVSYTAGPLDAGDFLSFTVVSRESPAEGTRRASSNGLAVGIIALAVAGGAVFLLWRSPLPQEIPPDVRSRVEAIAALDRDFEEGRIGQDVYRKERRALKRRLRESLSDQS
jgi:hypothetical protein